MSLTKILSVILAISAFLVYSGTIKNNYAFDDIIVLQDNSLVKQGIKAVPKLLTTPRMLGNQASVNDTYRPLSLVMFAIEYELFGLNPVIGHLINILFFSFCVSTLFVCLLKLFGQEKLFVVFLASLLFALHPIHTEVVANIKSRDEIMCFLFAFLALMHMLKYLDTQSSSCLAIANLFFFISLLSKETSFTFLAIFPLCCYVYNKNKNKLTQKIIITSSIIAFAFLAIRFIVLRKYNADHISAIAYIDNMLIKPPSASSAIATKLLILGKYLQLLLVPYPLICDYSYATIPFVFPSDWRVIITAVIYSTLIAIAIYRIRKNYKDVWAFAIFFYMITMSMCSNIPFLIGSQMAERFLFFPSVGFCLALAMAIKTFFPQSGTSDTYTWFHQKLLFVIVPVISIYSVITTRRNSEWIDNFTLFSADVAKAPQNCRLNNYMAIELNNKSDSEYNDLQQRDLFLLEARRYSLKAVEVSAYPQNVDALYSLATCYKKLGMYDSAEFFLRKGLIAEPNHLQTLNALGVVYGITKQYDESITLFKRILAIDSLDFNAHINLAGTYMKMKNYALAITYFSKANAIEPGNKVVLNYLAEAWQIKGNPDSTLKYKKLQQMNNNE